MNSHSTHSDASLPFYGGLLLLAALGLAYIFEKPPEPEKQPGAKKPKLAQRPQKTKQPENKPENEPEAKPGPRPEGQNKQPETKTTENPAPDSKTTDNKTGDLGAPIDDGSESLTKDSTGSAQSGQDTPASNQDKRFAPIAAPAQRHEFKDGASQWQQQAAVTQAGFSDSFGGPGQKPGQFAYPRAMTQSPDGRLYVVDKSGRIQRFSKTGQLELVIRTPRIDRGKPTGLGIDRDGNVLVADTHYSRVLVYSPDLKRLREYGEFGKKPGQFLFVTDVCQGPDGRHYVTDYGDDIARVQILSDQGKSLKAFGRFGTRDGEFQRPMALAVDTKRKELLVADAVNHRIQVFDLDGGHLRTLSGIGKDPGRLKYPYDVAVDAKGRLWVAEFGNHRVQVLATLTGESLGLLGQAGRKLGQVAFPWGVCLTDSGHYYLLDSGNNRVYRGLCEKVLKEPIKAEKKAE